jgi:hypothetical protein
MVYSELWYVVATVLEEPVVTYVPVSLTIKHNLYPIAKKPRCASLQLNFVSIYCMVGL